MSYPGMRYHASSILHGKDLHLPGCQSQRQSTVMGLFPYIHGCPGHGNLERERPSALEAIYVIWRPAETFPRNLIR